MATLKVRILKKLRRSDSLVTLICKVANEKKETLISTVYSEEWGELPKNGSVGYVESVPTDSGRILYSYLGNDEVEDEEEAPEEPKDSKPADKEEEEEQ